MALLFVVELGPMAGICLLVWALVSLLQTLLRVRS